MILLVDNYDSFVYNLSRYFVELGCETHVVRNDRTSVAEIVSLSPTAIVLSPGPCGPEQAGVSTDFVRQLGHAIPILGVCLGHQVIAAALGGAVVRAAEPVHGRTSMIQHDGSELFGGIPDGFPATRYHSLIVQRESLPEDLRITAWTGDGLVMGIRHRRWPLHGVQFHPESVLTEHGHQLLRNFLDLAEVTERTPGALEYLPAEEPVRSLNMVDGFSLDHAVALPRSGSLLRSASG